jgi:outer membrane murein-binding lipoprotein Lpp
MRTSFPAARSRKSGATLLVTALTIGGLALLAGCANNQVADAESIQSQALAAAATAQQTPGQLLEQALALKAQANADNLDFFAPLHMQQAQDNLDRAGQGLKDPLAQATVAQQAIAAKTFIEKGYQNKKLVEVQLQPALQQLDVLKSIDTPSLLPDDYNESVADLRDIIQMFEGGQIPQGIEKQKAVIAAMIAVEIKTLKKVHMSAALAFREKADEADAEEFARITLDAADKKIAEAQRFIETSYRDRLGVARQGTGHDPKGVLCRARRQSADKNERG